MIIEKVVLGGTVNRFCIFDGELSRKIFSIFRASGDGSLAFHSYLSSDITGEVDLESVATGQTIKVSSVEMHEFKLHKVNFHRSGVVTRKGKNGERKNDDFWSIDFRTITDAVTLFVYQPLHFSNYPAINDDKPYFDLIQSHIEYLPPNVQVILIKKGHNLERDFKEACDSTLFINKEILGDFDLDLCINIRAHLSQKYPPYEVVTSILYKN